MVAGLVSAKAIGALDWLWLHTRLLSVHFQHLPSTSFSYSHCSAEIRPPLDIKHKEEIMDGVLEWEYNQQ